MTALLTGPDPESTRRTDDHQRDPGRHPSAGRLDQERCRDRRPVDRVRLGRRECLDAVPPRPGRLHADPVQHRSVGRLPDRGRDGDGLRQRGDRPRRAGRSCRLRRSAAGDLRRPAGVRCRAVEPGSGVGQRGRLRGDLPDRDPRRAPGKSILDQQVMATCGTGCRGTFAVSRAVHRQQGASGGPSGSTTRRPRTGRPRTPATIRSG